MAHPDLNPDRQCKGKRTYTSKKEARAAIKRIQTVGGRSGLGSDPLKPYMCPHCASWHFGHVSPALKARLQRHTTAEES